ncbi:MAG: hypothetical protein ABI586_07490 [Candidatus Nanopelagicales bacterium]
MSSQSVTSPTCPEWCMGNHKVNDPAHTSDVLHKLRGSPNDPGTIHLHLCKYDDGTPEETQTEVDFRFDSGEWLGASMTMREQEARELAGRLLSMADEIAAGR